MKFVLASSYISVHYPDNSRKAVLRRQQAIHDVSEIGPMVEVVQCF